MDRSVGAGHGQADLMDVHVDTENPFMDMNNVISHEDDSSATPSQTSQPRSSLHSLRPSTPTNPSTPSRRSSRRLSGSPGLGGSSVHRPDPEQPSSSRPTPVIPQGTNANRSSIAKPPGLGLGLSFDRSANSASVSAMQGSPARNGSIAGRHTPQLSFSQLQRAPSVASSSFQPAHPYGLYTQGTFEDMYDNNDVATTSAPVGFPGHNTNFSRNRGADGEELGVVGPDGHTEQLPPYTRYPVIAPAVAKDAPTTTALLIDHPETTEQADETSAPSTSNVGAQHVAVPVAAGDHDTSFLDMGHLQPLPSPIAPSPVLQSTFLGPSRPSEAHVCSHTTSEASSMLEKPYYEEKQRRRKRDKLICGAVPLWVLVVFAFLCMGLAVIAGGVVGGIISKNQKHRNSNLGSGTVTVTSAASLYDASPIPAPTGIAPLPVGTFFFPLGAPTQQERSCIEPSRDSTAWACSVANQLMLIDFRTIAGTPNARLYPAPPPAGWEGQIQYGDQPPRGTYPMQKLQWVEDTKDTSRGPALYFQSVYNKVVIIEGEKFPSPGGPLNKRQLFRPAQKDYNGPAPAMSSAPPASLRRWANKPGEQPWYCYWNNTTLEGYIYVQDDVPGATTQKFTASEITDDATAAATTSRPTSASAATATSSTDQSKPRVSARAVLHPRSAAMSTGTPTAPITTAPARFPLIVKVSERRYVNPSFQPFCQQMMVNGDGSTVPKLDSGGNKIIEMIKEPGAQTASNSNRLVDLGPSYAEYARGVYGAKFRRTLQSVDDDISAAELARRDTVTTTDTNGCICQWISPFG